MKEYLTLVIKSISNRKLRVSLTVIGVIIGIAAIVGLLTLSNALQNAIETQLEEFGGNSLTVLSSGFSISENRAGVGLTTRDLETIEKSSVIDHATGYLVEYLVAEYKDTTRIHQIIGVPAKYSYRIGEEFNWELQEGKYFKREGETIILGYNVATDRFNRTIKLGNTITINERKFNVLGILEKQNSPDADNVILMPLATLREINGKTEALSYIDARVVSGLDINDSRRKVERQLSRIRDESSFKILTAADFLKVFNQIFGIVRTTLLSVATISLLVGTIGIANAIYSSVVERTAQIGLMKAIGATRKDIQIIYVLEAAIIGLFGGIVGSIIGTALAYIVEQVSRSSGLDIFSTTINPLYIMIGILIAVIAGVIAGITPARQASLLEPVVAMRKK